MRNKKSVTTEERALNTSINLLLFCVQLTADVEKPATGWWLGHIYCTVQP
jgi:hypothetical protein